MPPTSRKTYTYGTVQQKTKTSASSSWDDIAKKSPKKLAKIPQRKGIWSKVTVSPFKHGHEKKQKTVITNDRDDPFGFCDSDPYEFDDHESSRKNIKSVKKNLSQTKSTGSPLKKKTKSPIKSQKKLLSPPQSPTGLSRVFGKAMPHEHVTITVDDLLTFGSPKKTKNKKTDTKKSVVKQKTSDKNLPITKNGKVKLSVKTSSIGMKDTMKENDNNERCLNEIKFVDENDISTVVNSPVKRNVSRKTNRKSKVLKEESNDEQMKTDANSQSDQKHESSVDLSVVIPKKRGRPKTKNISKVKQNILKSSEPESENISEEESNFEQMESNVVKNTIDNGDTDILKNNNISKTGILSKSIDQIGAESSSQNSESSHNSKDLKIKAKLKAAPLFTYYDKQKVTAKSNIYGDSKKSNLIMSDSDEDMPDSLDTVVSDKSDNIHLMKRSLFDDSEDKSHNLKRQKVCDDIGSSQGSSTTGDSQMVQSSMEIIDSSQEKQDNVVKVKSPFKSLKARSTLQNRKMRRFSALPTSVPAHDSSDEEDVSKEEEEVVDEEEEGNEIDTAPPLRSPPPLYTSALFGFSRVDTAVRVKKTEKELFTVVKNTKHAYECLEHGESQLFKDDIEYLIDGLKPSHNISTRCLSALELASKCISPAFRMHVKAHGIIETIFTALHDAIDDERLALSTSTIMYVLAKDRLKLNFNKKIIEFMLKLLSTKTSDSSKNKEYEKIVKKVRVILEKQENSFIDLDNIDAALVARETLLSFTSQRIGEWFKEEIRTLGGLDHLVDTIYACSKCIHRNEELNKNFRVMERCMLLLCDMAFRNSKNQQYLDSYRNSLLIESCIRILISITSKMNLTKNMSIELQDCLSALLQLLTNLSHENESGSIKICKQNEALHSILRCALYVPQFLDPTKTFDCTVVSIGLLINLVEHNRENAKILNTSLAPEFYESQSASESSQQIVPATDADGDDDTTDHLLPVEALMQLFLLRYEACKEGDLMEELDKLENEQEEKDAAMHYHDDEYALTCGDNFDDTVEESEENKTTEEIVVESSQPSSNQIDLNQKEKQDIKNTLEKAHKHMEDCHIAAYTALLIGLLSEDNEDNEETVHSLLPNGDFSPMRLTLAKILGFMKMTGAMNESGFKVIERIIDIFKVYETKYGSSSSVIAD